MTASRTATDGRSADVLFPTPFHNVIIELKWCKTIVAMGFEQQEMDSPRATRIRKGRAGLLESGTSQVQSLDEVLVVLC